MAQAVRDVMTTDLETCPTDTPIEQVARTMRDRDIGDVLVTEGDRLRGIVTDRDLVVRCLAEKADPSTTTVGGAVSGDLVVVTPDMPVEEAIRLMAEHSVRRLPVVEDGRPVGILTMGDLAMERDPSSVLADVSAAPPNN